MLRMWVTCTVGVRWHKLEVPTKQLTPVFNDSRGAFAERFWAEVAAESGPITWHDTTLEQPQDPQQTGASSHGSGQNGVWAAASSTLRACATSPKHSDVG